MKLKAILLIIAVAAYASAGDLSDRMVKSDQYLSRVKDMIAEETESIKLLQDEKLKKARELKKAEIDFSYQKRIAKRLENKLIEVSKNVGSLTFKQQELKNRQKELTDNIKSANFYLAGAGETELLEALILSDELAELTAGLQIISRVNTRLFEMVEELTANSIMLQQAKDALIITKKEYEMTLQEKTEVLNDLKNKKILVNQLYKIASEDEKIQQEYISLLKKKQDELEDRLIELAEESRKEDIKRKYDGLKKNFDTHKKRIMWPVSGKVIEKFGTKKVEGFKGVVHKKGIKIRPNESQVASVYDGIVIHTDTAWGLGWFVIVEHFGGYYSLYANLDEIVVIKGQKVHTGEVLGTIDIDRGANTPYLYFEIRIHDKAVDPLEWLPS